jgi:predicted RNA methylase
MVGLINDFAKLIRLFREGGTRRAVGSALLAIRARLMRHSDAAWETSLGLSYNESDVCLNSLRIESPNKQHGFSYVPCTRVAVRTLLDSINRSFNRCCFVDFGSGEGRSLMIAAAYPFDEVIGVEFAEELHQAAVRNIAKAGPALAGNNRIQSIRHDAAQFDIPRKDCVLYFYNPFGEVVFQEVLKNIERVYRESGAKFFIVFHQTRADLENNNTKNAELLRAAPFLKPCDIRFPSLWTRFLLGSQDLYIFETLETVVDDQIDVRQPIAEKPSDSIVGLPTCTTAGMPSIAAMVLSP